MAVKDLIIYQTEDGKEPFTRWRKRLKDKITVARIDRRLDWMTEGHYGDHKAVGEGVYELRLFFGPGYRVYFAEDGDQLVLLLCGGDKGSQTRDISAAQRYWQTTNRVSRRRKNENVPQISRCTERRPARRSRTGLCLFAGGA